MELTEIERDNRLGSHPMRFHRFYEFIGLENPRIAMIYAAAVGGFTKSGKFRCRFKESGFSGIQHTRTDLSQPAVHPFLVFQVTLIGPRDECDTPMIYIATDLNRWCYAVNVVGADWFGTRLYNSYISIRPRDTRQMPFRQMTMIDQRKLSEYMQEADLFD